MIKIFSLRQARVIIFIVALVSVGSLALVVGKGVNAQSIPACTDSDSTPDYYGLGPEQVSRMNDLSKYIKGTITAPDANGFWRTAKHYALDECETSNKVREHYCDRGKYFGYTILNCPNGCKDGACVKEEPKSTCTDSDGGKDYSVKGTVKESASPLMDYTDMCGPGSSAISEGNELIEWSCGDKGRVINEYYNCPNGCSDGVCVEEPSEEDLERIENQKKIQELITGAKGMTGMLDAINVMQRAFMQLAKQGVAMPEELAQTIVRVKELGPEMNDFKNRTAENVTDEEAETLTDNVNELCEMGLTLEDWGNQVPQFFQLGARIKQLSKDLKKAKSDVKLASKAAARSKFGISDKSDELNGAIEALKATSDDAIASTDFDEKDGKINEFYDQFRDIYDTIGVINALQNTAKAKTEWGKRVKANVSTISQLSKNAELDVSELVVKNDEVKAKLDELSPALAKKPMDRDEVKWIFEDLKARQSEFIDIADQLRGVKSALPKVQVTKFDTSQFKNFGAFSQFCGVSLQNDDGEENPENAEF